MAAPSRIPLSGYERLKQRNYYTVNLEGPSDRGLLVERLTSEGVAGLWFNGPSSHSEQRTLSSDQLLGFDLLITHYWRELELRYRSPLTFLLHEYLHLPRLRLAKERLGRWLFNRRSLAQSDSIHVLRWIVDQTVRNQNFGCNAATVLQAFYGPRVFHHPNFESLHRYYGLVLDGLKVSGELEYENGFRPLPRAIARIEQFDLDAQRFERGTKLQRAIVILTIVIAVATAAQAYTAFISGSASSVKSPNAESTGQHLDAADRPAEAN